MKQGAWRVEARKLREAGMSHAKIARAVGVHLSTVKRLFDVDVGDNPIRTAGGYSGWPDVVFIQPHVYRQIPKLPAGRIVERALKAVQKRQELRAAADCR